MNRFTKKVSIYKTIFFAGALFIAIFLATSPAVAQSPPVQEPDFLPGEILVKFKPHVGRLGAQRSLEAEGLRPLEVSPRTGLMRVQVTPGLEKAAIARLMSRGDVEIASVNHIIYAAIDPNDPSYSQQWGFPKIEAPAAWDMSTGSSSVTVAVVDSGLDTSHSEFSGRIVDPRDEISNDSTPQDTCGHGTHVAGTIAAKGNNGAGVAGMAWDINVMPVRALTSNGSGCTGNEGDIHDAIYWAVSHGAKVINLSLGAPSYGSTCEDVFPFMSQAVADAYNAGVLVVAASGNNSASTLSCPALQAETLAVGATTNLDQRAWFSNYGTGLNVVAPGTNIYSTWPGESYTSLDGTSMAAPHVSGLAALLWSVDSSLTNFEVWDAIQTTADDLGASGYDLEYGHGRINARRALEQFASIGILETSGDPVNEPILFLIDDDNEPIPDSKLLQVVTASPNPITWTATISPSSATWLNVSPPASGQISAATSDQFALSVTQPISYGIHTATVVVTGTTSAGAVVGPATSQVQISSVPELQKLRLPLIFKN